MRSYSVFAQTSDTTQERAVFVPEGFSWRAFAFTFVWALWHRMWIVALLLGAISLAAGILPAALQAAIGLGIAIATGVFAADLRRWSLARQHYQEVATVNAASPAEAEIRFYCDPPHGIVSSPPAARQPRLPAHDPLGLFTTSG
jgi:hypothetical protein